MEAEISSEQETQIKETEQTFSGSQGNFDRAIARKC